MSALAPGTTITGYLSKDSFEKVVAFYRGLGRQYTNPNAPGGDKLSSGPRIETAFLIFDDAPDVRTSRNWISIRHSFVRSVSRTKQEYRDTGSAMSRRSC